LESRWEVPNSRRQPIGDKSELPSGYQLKHGNFHSFSLKCLVSVYIILKLRKQWKNFKTLTFSGFSPIFALSNHTTFSQTQTGATVPFILNDVH
jgi:hypothetical protein